MDELEFLYNKIKNAEVEDNVVLPKEYLRKFIIMNLLLIKENVVINDDIYKYLKNNIFVIPSTFERLNKEKQDKYLKTLESLIRLF